MPCDGAGKDNESKNEQTKRKANSEPTSSPKKTKLFCSGTAYQPKAPANAIGNVFGFTLIFITFLAVNMSTRKFEHKEFLKESS